MILTLTYRGKLLVRCSAHLYCFRFVCYGLNIDIQSTIKMMLLSKVRILAGLSLMLSVSLFFGWGIGLCLAVVAILAKEWFDSLSYGTPNILDIVATFLGVTIGVALYLTRGLL